MKFYCYCPFNVIHTKFKVLTNLRQKLLFFFLYSVLMLKTNILLNIFVRTVIKKGHETLKEPCLFEI